MTIETNAVEQIKKLFTSLSTKAKDIKGDAPPFTIKGQSEINHKEFEEIHAGTTIYTKSEESATELIVCQRANELSWLNRTAMQIFKQSSLAIRFVTKGYIVKTNNETCHGMIYYSADDKDAIDAIRLFVNRNLAANFPINFEEAQKFVIRDTVAHSRIKVGDEMVEITFRYYNVPLNFLSHNVQWEQAPQKRNSASLKYLMKHGGKDHRVILEPKEESPKWARFNALTTLQGTGLHQKMIKSLFVEEKGHKVALDASGECRIILVDPLTDQTYVDQDEIRYNSHMELKRFEVLDIEKPTETAKQLLWMIRMKVDDLKKISGKNTELLVEYPVHFRYRSPATELFAISQLSLRTQMFSNCEHIGGVNYEEDIHASEFYVDKVKQLYGNEYKHIPLRHYNSYEDYKQGKIVEYFDVKVPVGNIAIKEKVTIITLIISLIGAFTLFYYIQKSSKAKVE